MSATTAARQTAAASAPKPESNGIRPRWRRWWDARHPRRDSLQLHHGNVYILPTRAGWVFGLTLLVLLLASINFQLNLGYMLTFLLGGSAVVSMHVTHRNLRGLALHLREPQPVHAGESALLDVVLDHQEARSRLALGLRAGDAAHGVADWTWCDLAPQASTTVHLSVAAEQRGRHPLPRIVLHTRYPFGLFHAWSVWRPAAQLLVWPQPEAPPAPLAAAAESPAGSHQARPRPGEEVDGVRDWRRGDPLRLIAWKKSSRTLASTGTLVSRERESRVQRDTWLEWSAAAPLPPEARLSRLTAWVWMLDRTGATYGLRLPGQELPPGSGDLHRLRCLEALAMWQSPR